MKLTDHLLSIDTASLKKATEHTFLTQVGQLQVKPDHLINWLFQDQYYTGGYVKMLGLMLSRLPLYQDQRELGDHNPSYTPERAQAIFSTLSFALANISREMAFFQQLLQQAPSQQQQKPWTAQYVNYVCRVVREANHDLGEALVVLWAMEVVFLKAWSFAKQEMVQTGELDGHQQMCCRLIENWTTDEFVGFVDDCGDLVNQLDIKDPSRLASLERVYRDILALEVKFWDMAYD